jgi:alcohol dehydrogenase (cytochrome c)
MGAVGPPLLPFTRSSRELLAIVREGGAQMMSFTSRDLSDEEVAAIAQYLASLNRTAPSTPEVPARVEPARVEPARATAAAAPRPAVVTLSQTPALTPVSDAMLANPAPADWLNWRRTSDGWGYSPLNQITRANVKDLKLAWSWALEPGPSQTAPVVHDGVMYVANPGNVVHALDARTGDLHWEYRRPMDDRRRASAQMRSLAIYQDVVLLNTVDAHIVALDARSGSVRWDTPVGAEGSSFTFTSGPLVADGVIVAGLTGCSRFDTETCYLVGVDGLTGRLLWKTSTIARPGEPGGDTWGDVPLEFRAGGDAWIPGSYDPVLKLVFWGTAQAKPWARFARGTEDDALYTNSTLALDPRTGSIRWHFQHVPGESYDMDEVFERILIDYDGLNSVFTMGKLGILWELNRRNGRFLRATDLGYQTLVDVDKESGKATYRPGTVQTAGKEVSFCPSTGGIKTLRALAYHPDTRALYAPLNLNCETAVFQAVERRIGGGGAGPVQVRGYDFHPKSPDKMGEMQALDVRTGTTIWRQRRRAPYNTAALTTGGGIVFVGTWDRYALAYDARTGDQLWSARLPTMANGFPITFSAGGRQYVAFGAGASIQGSSWATRVPAILLPEIRNPDGGNGLFVFALTPSQ